MKDNVTLPIQRVREAVSELIKTSEDKDTGQELMECNRRLAELREEVAMFLSQSAEDHVYWVERTGKAQRIWRSMPRRSMSPSSCATGFSVRHLRHHDQRDAGCTDECRPFANNAGREPPNRASPA